MGIFSRRSKWEKAIDAAGALVASGSARRAAKVGAGVVAGLVGATAMSAAVSSVRESEES
jgi:hypothetical protein